MKKFLMLFSLLPFLTQAKSDVSASKLESYFVSYKNDPNSFESDAKLLTIVTEVLPEKYEDFEKSTYINLIDRAWAKKDQHPAAVLNLISYIEDRRSRIYARLASESNQDHMMYSTATGTLGALATVASPYVANAAVNKVSTIRASGALVSLNSRLQQQKWLKNPWLQAGSAFIGAGAGMAYHYTANEMGWSLGNLPPSPLEHLGFNTEGYSKFDKADSFNMLPKTIDTALFIPLSPLVLAASLGVSKLITKPFACIPAFEKIGTKLDQHPRVRSVMRFLNPVVWAGMGLSYVLLDALTDKITDPLAELAYYKNYQRALKQLEDNKNDPVKFELAKEELYLRLMDLHKILAGKVKNKMSKDIRKILDDNKDDKIAADKIENYLKNSEWSMSESDLNTRSWMKLIEIDPGNEPKVLNDVMNKANSFEITNSAHLFLHAAATLRAYNQEPVLKGVPLIHEAFREWTLLEVSTISLKGEDQ
ncbi:MAG: hypothetical protein KA116_00245 [Proteobacteria bacterium]|nr:hypothetical protein [Pseudomonadota bacterium]